MAASGRIAAGLERWCRAGRRKHKGRRDLRRQARLDPMARERVRALEVSHRRFHVFPADVFHQGLDVPAVCIRPRGEATSQRVSAVCCRCWPTGLGGGTPPDTNGGGGGGGGVGGTGGREGGR